MSAATLGPAPVTSATPRPGRGWWRLALAGQFFAVFAAVALSGPGRIDIVDGQTRYEVARSLVEHGDVAVRDERVWFMAFPGGDGRRYSFYRFPQSGLGACAIWLADATGPGDEARRHFFFTLTSAFACALLPLAYALWFRRLGFRPGAACAWAMAGVFCTPSWFYGTTTFDDILGSAAVVWAIAVAYLGRDRAPRLGALAGGMLVGLAFNCKEPLGIFGLAVLAAVPNGGLPLRRQLPRFALAAAGVLLGVVAYRAYELAKSPPAARAALVYELSRYPPFFSGNPLPALLGLTLSPGTGAIWYCPTLLLSAVGLSACRRTEKGLCRAVLASGGIFFGFVCCLTFFSGDPAWGPRYLTPVFAVLWLFAPSGAARLPRGVVRIALGLGVLVQLLGLSVDPHRLYIQRGLPSAFYYEISPWLYFDGAVAHLSNRPREIAEIIATGHERPPHFSPAPAPTFTIPVTNHIARPEAPLAAGILGLLLDPQGTGPLAAAPLYIVGRTVETGPEAVRRYQILNAFRPWWASQGYLSRADRPVDLAGTFILLSLVLAGGLALTCLGCRASGGQSEENDE